MVDGPEFERWRAEADGALESARLSASGELHNWACFSAEQAAQLAVEALLHGLGRGPWGHDLVALGRSVAASDVTVPPSIAEAFGRLSRHYISSRYPDAHAAGPARDHYGPGDSAAAIADAEAVLEFVDEAWVAL